MTGAFDNVLKPLIALGHKFPQIEAQVIWAEAGTWQPQDDDIEGLDGEEIAFYAEGLLAEGYGCAYQVLGQGTPEFLRLFFWHSNMPDLPDDPDLINQTVLAS